MRELRSDKKGFTQKEWDQHWNFFNYEFDFRGTQGQSESGTFESARENSDELYTYIGDWKAGKPHGRGLMLEHGHSLVLGWFREGQVHGHAKQFFLDTKLTYEGMYENGVFAGQGTHRQKDWVDSGIFKAGKILNGTR